MGEPKLSVPGSVTATHSVPPSSLETGRDYEVLGAMLANGYSQAQMEQALKSLGLPFSREALGER